MHAAREGPRWMSKDHKSGLKQDRPVLPEEEFSKSLAGLGFAVSRLSGCTAVAMELGPTAFSTSGLIARSKRKR